MKKYISIKTITFFLIIGFFAFFGFLTNLNIKKKNSEIGLTMNNIEALASDNESSNGEYRKNCSSAIRPAPNNRALYCYDCSYYNDYIAKDFTNSDCYSSK